MNKALLIVVCVFILTGYKNNNEKPDQSINKSQPNFIVIFTDDLGYQDLGCFGSPNIRTPHIDAMAEEGMRFTNFYAQTVCGPSRSSLMTGCYPLRVARKNDKKEHHPNMANEEITIAELLKDAGYTTGCFGKWDLAGHDQEKYDTLSLPTRQGFDYFYGTPSSNDTYVNLLRNEEVIERKADLNTLTKKYTEEVIGFIRKNQDKPFFVYLPHTMPHTRLGASKAFKGKSERGLYGDVIEEIDWSTGQILACIKELRLEKNTYVLFTSDNGPWWLGSHPWLSRNKDKGGWHGGTATPLRGNKCTTWEGGLRVPGVLWGPERVKANSTSDQITATIDILPTLAKLAGAKVPDDRIIDGKDISALFLSPEANFYPERPYYYYSHDRLQAVRKGPWKLHLPYTGTYPKFWELFIKPEDRVNFNSPALYNLSKDVGEQNDVASQYPEVVNELLELVEVARNDIGDYNKIGKGARSFKKLPVTSSN